MARLGREAWVKLMEEFVESGLSQRDFAEQRELSLGTLRFWIYKLQRETKAPRFLPVHVVASPAQARAAGGELIEVALPRGVLLRFAAGTDPSYLAQLLSALA